MTDAYPKWTREKEKRRFKETLGNKAATENAIMEKNHTKHNNTFKVDALQPMNSYNLFKV